MNSSSFQSNTQEVLLTTIHNQDSVVEVYLNDDRKIITELLHLSGLRVKVYQYKLENYKQRPGTFEIFQKI